MKIFDNPIMQAKTAVLNGQPTNIFFDACAILHVAQLASEPLTIHDLTSLTARTANTLYPVLNWLVAHRFMTHAKPAPHRPATYALFFECNPKNESRSSSISSSSFCSSQDFEMDAPANAMPETARVTPPTPSPKLNAMPRAAHEPVTAQHQQAITALAAQYNVSAEWLVKKEQERRAKRPHEAFSAKYLETALQLTKENAVSSPDGYFWKVYVMNGIWNGQIAQASGAPQSVTNCHQLPKSSNGVQKRPTNVSPSQHTAIANSPRRIKASNEVDGKTYDQGELAANVKALTQQVGQPMPAPLAEVTRPAPVETSPATPLAPDAVFRKMQDILEHRINQGAFNTWLRPVRGRFENDVLTLTVLDEVHQYWLTDNYKSLLHETCETVTGKKPQNIAFIISEGCA